MTTKHKIYYSTPWTVLKFEKRGISLVYNNDTKKYNFYKNLPVKIEPLAKKKSNKFTPLGYAFIALTALLGISLAANIFTLLGIL